MGGNIAWTVRKQDGSEMRMERWTNIFPDVTVSDAYLSGDAAAFDAAMKSWVEMKADWEENKATGQYRHNMTSVYAPYPGLLAPSEYGFVVTDFVTKTILSCNGYTRIKREYVYSPSSRRGDVTIHGEVWVDYEARLQAMWDAGRIREYGQPSKPVGEMTFAEMSAAALVDFGGSGMGMIFVEPIAPWVVFDFSDDSRADKQAAYDKLKELGFVRTPKEEKAFRSWIRR